MPFRRTCVRIARGHEILLAAYKTDVRPECAQMRAALGAAEDPIAELPPYVERITAERGADVGVAGGWGR